MNTSLSFKVALENLFPCLIFMGTVSEPWGWGCLCNNPCEGSRQGVPSCECIIWIPTCCCHPMSLWVYWDMTLMGWWFLFCVWEQPARVLFGSHLLPLSLCERHWVSVRDPLLCGCADKHIKWCDIPCKGGRVTVDRCWMIRLELKTISAVYF